LINLLSNAVKFTPDGGCVTLTTQEENGYLVMKVCDTGIGISAQDLARIGQPFFQVQNDYTRTFEGTGLGLSLVRGLVELHAGGLSIESEPGAGTDVIVRLPIAGPAKARRADLSRLDTRKDNMLAVTPARTNSATQGAGHEPAIRKTA
jgi:two-component system, cell cycle sensor histidine kinase DivJ